MTEQSSPQHRPPAIGILALQGAYEAHAKILATLEVTTRLIRTPDQLFTPECHPSIDGLIIPGGESTTMLKFLERNGFLESLTTFVRTVPTFGTCAGAILLANDVQNPPQISLAALDITIERNAYGRQLHSTILTAPTKLPGAPLEMVFIRAPRITRTGPQVETLATRDDFPVLVRQGNLLAATFHPELGHDPRVHELFLQLVQNQLSVDSLRT
ncbi:pyridoxal 5'-phosphate synthase glutaminase subunit PdxT [Tunturiibacter gelidoferens]|uniref:5'-phosphate synthase pdxT subunit n=1 Tax=Tunturiibacter gelidiferens TaxID=3069689 RepID=A0ACC5NVV0_9BACT|nr:pyridoxal 5'-phosphate synthase glutaminase subunit PdxT [Edaphobacter lichenicola]MBB5338722.1 5'-phosphate synthase pdxT subunit [Edaphobacter lichenicola]